MLSPEPTVHNGILLILSNFAILKVEEVPQRGFIPRVWLILDGRRSLISCLLTVITGGFLISVNYRHLRFDLSSLFSLCWGLDQGGRRTHGLLCIVVIFDCRCSHRPTRGSLFFKQLWSLPEVTKGLFVCSLTWTFLGSRFLRAHQVASIWVAED